MSAALPVSPYKGLSPFVDSELDERFFFGREREVELVADNLVASRLSVLYGPSGVGKSSLLRAGVVRRLRALVPAGGAAEGEGALPVVVDDWRDDPIAAIAAGAGATAPASPAELADVLAERVAEVGGELYLVLDQLEEYFVYHGRARVGPLREALGEILGRGALRVHVLLGIRDDALAELDAFKGRVPGLFANVLRLDHLDVDAATAAIVEPLAVLAALGGPRIEAEPALVAAVVDQVASGRIERRLAGRGMVPGGARRGRVEAPYLQLVMDRIWQVERERGSTILRAATLTELGGAGRIVQQHLERALERLDEPERELVARLFHQLVTPSGTKIAHAVDDLGRYAGESPERLDDVLHALSVERVVRALPARNGGGPRYEIFHDVLADAVLDWRSRHEAERALAEARAAARRRHRRLAAIVGLALVGLALMGLLTVYAFSQRAEAREQAEAARSAQLAAEASEQEADAERDATKTALAQSKQSEQKAIDAQAQTEAALARESEQRERAEAETARANEATGLAREATARANEATADAEAHASSEREAKEDALAAKSAEVVQRRQAERAFAGERRARREALRSRDEARASALVSQAVSQLETDPEQSMKLAIESATLAPAFGLEAALRDSLMRMRARFVLPGGAGPVESIDVSPDGALAVVAAGGAEARVYTTASGRLLSRLGHGAPVRVALFAPDGRSVLTGGEDGDARRWDPRTGTLLARYDHGTAPIQDLTVSADGGLVVTAASEAARVWSPDGTPIARLPQPFIATDVSFSPDGARLLVLARDARLYDTRNFARAALVLDQPGRIITAAFAPVGDLVATGGQDDLATIWNSGSGERLHELQHRGDVLDLAWSPRADVLATASFDNGGRIFRADTGDLVTFLGLHSNQVVGVAFSPDGASVATASLDGSARIWGADGFGRSAALLGHTGQVLDVAFAPDGESVLTASSDGSVRVWKPAVDPLLSVVGRSAGAGRAVAVSRSGLIATVGLDNTLRVWRRNGALVRAIPHDAQLADVSFSSDGRLVVTAGSDGVARVWRVADGVEVQSFGQEAPLLSAVFDTQGERVLTGGADGIARIWRRLGGPPQELRHGGGAVTAAVFSPDGRVIATAGANGEGRIWRAATRRLLGKLTGQHDDGLTSIAYSPDGKWIATSSTDADAHVWNAATFAHVRALRGHSAVVSDVAFSPDSRWIATAGPTTVGLWEARTARRIEKSTPALFLRGHGPRVRSVAFFPDSRRVATVGDDGTLRTYLCELCGSASELIRLGERRLDRLGANLTQDERARYLGG